jgi:hypothetical protein
MTLRQARVRHAPPAVVVLEETYNPLCCMRSWQGVVLAGVGALQPQTTVTLSRAGEVEWIGHYGTAGRLWSAQERIDDLWFEVRVVRLPELGESLALFTRSAQDHDGAPGAWTDLNDSSLAGERYLGAMEAAPSHRRGDLADEALRKLPLVGQALVQWLVEHGSDADVADALTPQPVVSTLVETYLGYTRPLHPGFQPLLEAVGAEPRGPESAAAAMCQGDFSESAVQLVVEQICDRPDGVEWALARFASCELRREAWVLRERAACPG